MEPRLWPFLLGAAWTVAILFGILYLSRNRNFATKHGRVAVRQFVEGRGQTLVSLAARPAVRDPDGDGLGKGSMLFDAVARAPGGGQQTYRLAFDPTGAKGAKPGLKQFDDGAWRDAS
jgi:hypothetical protein